MQKNIYEIHENIDDNMPFIFHSNSILKKKRNPPNWHENFELFLCTEGEGKVHLDAETVDFRPGDIVIVNRNVMHALASETSIRSYCLIVSNEFCRQNGIEISEHYFSKHIRSERLYNLCMDAFEKIEEYNKNPKYYVMTAIRGKLCAIMAELCENHVETGNDTRKLSPATEERIKKLIIYINNNFTSDLNLDKLSKFAGISKYHLARDFKKITDQTFFEFINNMRCKNAKHLISNGSSVSEAAYNSGFNNLSYFTRKFKEITGKSPSYYIKRYKSSEKNT